LFTVLDSPLPGTKHVNLAYDSRKDLNPNENCSTCVTLVRSSHELMNPTCSAPHQTEVHQQEQNVGEDHSTGSPVQQSGDQLIGQQGEVSICFRKP